MAGISDPFNTKPGIEQSCVHPPILFNFYIIYYISNIGAKINFKRETKTVILETL